MHGSTLLVDNSPGTIRKTKHETQGMNATRKGIQFLSARVLFAVSISLGTSGSAQEQSHAIVVPAIRHITTAPLRDVAPGFAHQERSSRFGVSIPEPPRMRMRQHSRFTFHPDASPSLSTNAGLNILGIGNGFSGYTQQANIAVANGAAGATQFVQFVNESFAVFDKSSGRLIFGPANGNTLWQSLGPPCSTTSDLDETAQYDKLNDVWVMMMPQYANPPDLCIAVSTTSDATGAWNLYVFNIPKNTTCNCSPMPDYPKLGVWPDAYYISFAQAVNLIYQGPAVCAVDSSSMRSGAPASMQCFYNSSTYNALLPSDVDGTTPPPSGSPNYFLDFNSNNQSLDIWEFHVDWTTPGNSTWTQSANIPVPAFIEPCGDAGTVFTPSDNCVPQSNTSEELGAFGDRLMYRLAYRNFGNHESLVANHTVQVGTGSYQTGIRWYELQSTGSGFGLYQQGTYAPDSNYRWMGSIAMDKVGDIALGYNVSGSSMSPSIRYTGHLATDALGAMESEIDVLSGAGVATASQTNSARWGDFSSMAIDPTDDCTFWYTNEYQPAKGNNFWSTRIISFNFPDCAGGFTLGSSPASLSFPAGGQGTITLTVTPLGGFNSAISFSCPNLPAGLTCSFNPSQVTPAGSAVTSQLTIAAVSSAGLRRLPTPFLPAIAIVAAVCLVGWRMPRNSRLMLMLALAMAASEVLAGCGGGSGSAISPPAPVTSTVTVAATAGNVQQTAAISVTVN
jgi:hypothetical protein